MKRSLRLWFYPEIMLGAITGVMFVATLFYRAWIEAAFRIDPDQGSGLLEWAIVVVLLVATAVFFSLARYEWRRAAPAAA